MRGRIGQDIYRRIARDIADGTLQPGDRLDEKYLAQRFRISRTPAREALLQLAADGIVRFVPRRGAIILGLSPQLAIGMVEVLTALEAEAASLAARRMTFQERTALRKVHLQAHEAVSAEDSAAYIEANSRFHLTIYSGARNNYLCERVTATRERMRLFRHHGLTQPARLHNSWEEHDAVVTAIERGDELGAQKAMRSHISVGGTLFADMVSSLPTIS